MNKKLSLVAASLMTLALSAGCDKSPLDVVKSELSGELKDSTWVGKSGAWELTLKVTSHNKVQDNHAITAELTGNQPECFAADSMTPKLKDSKFEFTAKSNGDVADETTVTFIGDLAEDKITGTVTISAAVADEAKKAELASKCNLTDAAIVFEKQQ